MKILSQIAKHVGRYEEYPGRAEGLAQATVSADIDPKAALGKYAVTQRRLGQLYNTLLWANSIRPDIVSEGVVEAVAGNMQTFLQTGNINRASARYSQNKATLENKVRRTLTTGLNQLSESDYATVSGILNYFGLGYRRDKRVSFSDERIADIIDPWSTALSTIKQGRERIEAGGLSNSAFGKTMSEILAATKTLVSTGNKLGVDVKENSARIKQETETWSFEQKETRRFQQNQQSAVSRSLIGTIYGSLPAGMPKDMRLRMRDFYKQQDIEAKQQQQQDEKRRLARSTYLRTVGMIGAREVAGFGVSALESIWGESVTRNTYDSRRAQMERVKEGGKAAGAVIGAMIGGAIGSVIPVVGTAAGAMVGSGIGGTIGSLAGTYGKTKLESDIKSANQMTQRIRNKAMFGSSYSTFFAQALTDAGITNGESAMGQMASSAMGMRGRMMLGQVGEQEMLYMSMMPNYYAALMSGMTGPELARIYASDLNNIGDSSLRYVVGQAVGGPSAYTMARNPYFSANYGKLASVSAFNENALARLEYGYGMTASEVAAKNVRLVSKEIRASARRGDEDIYRRDDPDILQSQMKSLFPTMPITVNVNLDGEQIASAMAERSTTANNATELQSFFVGGF